MFGIVMFVFLYVQVCLLEVLWNVFMDFVKVWCFDIKYFINFGYFIQFVYIFFDVVYVVILVGIIWWFNMILYCWLGLIVFLVVMFFIVVMFIFKIYIIYWQGDLIIMDLFYCNSLQVFYVNFEQISVIIMGCVLFLCVIVNVELLFGLFCFGQLVVSFLGS